MSNDFQHVPTLLAKIMDQARSVLFPDNGTPDAVKERLSTLPENVKACQDARFGDYQINTAMILGKTRKLPPREVATKLIEQADFTSICEKVEIAGAGFINFHLSDDFVKRQLVGMQFHPHHGIPQVPNPSTLVIDFSSPNTAKSMHVGHIRSTFLGDALARITRAVGHRVITDNHIGDWGTQFGMLIYGYKTILDRNQLDASPIAELERIYKTINAQCDADEKIRETAKLELVKLQLGDAENQKIWLEITQHSLREFQCAYDRMGIRFDHQLGESAYNDELQSTIDELKELGVARVSEGAVCIFFDGPEDDPSLKDTPMLIQKSDGGFLYGTTDLATVRFREREWKAQQAIYVTDGRQQLHFRQLKAAVKKWNQARKQNESDQPFEIVHCWFGSILGPDKKPFKTRSGETVKLKDLLDEAEERALKMIEEKNPDFTPEEKRHAAQVLGIGALKYADLCQNRNLDYVFDWDKLLALQGNTAPYLIYAYVRIRSIFRSLESESQPKCQTIQPTESSEMGLAKHLIQFGDTVHATLTDYRPHMLTQYLYELAGRYSQFYEQCPVLKAEETVRQSRIALCQLTAQTLKTGLNLLGIQTLEKM